MLDFKITNDPATKEQTMLTSYSGKVLLTIPQLNKSTAFSVEERHEFDLFGKLPSHIETLEQQIGRAYAQFQSYNTPLQKNVYLNQLHDKNLVLFYALVKQHVAEMLPIIYTPTVGDAVEKFSREFSQARGLYIAYPNRHRIDEILMNRSHPEVDLIVVSDGSGVLGIGDQGVGAMMIPVAKLMVYTLCGGIDPLRTLPILLDVGTDNEALRNDPFYLGWRNPRISGKEYDEFIELFVTAIKRNFPQVFLHWEDFSRDTAWKILQRYRNDLCTFNDDIQGTGTVALAALTAAVKAKHENLSEQKIVIFGAGTAGTGIADQICEAMVRSGLTPTEASKRFWLIDRPGLLINDMVNLTPRQAAYARERQEISDWTTVSPQLIDVISHIKPTILIGCSAVSGAFNEQIITTLASYTERPIILPLSNPTSLAEARPQDVMDWTKGKALIATGSPFPPITVNGKITPLGQSNNAQVFPGIGLGVVAVKASRVSENMLLAACEAISEIAPVHKDPIGSILPPMDNAEQTSRKIGIAVAKQAIAEGLAKAPKHETVEELVDRTIWQPKYLRYKRARKM